jgi:hypothetical protein
MMRQLKHSERAGNGRLFLRSGNITSELRLAKVENLE